MQPVIIHISNDYPDPLRPDKTKAIKNLVESTAEFRHVIYSLNRVDGLGGISEIPFGEDRTAIVYGALPKGILWEKRLDEVARWIEADLKKKNIKPSLIHAHKITVEGLIGQHLATEFSCPLFCDIQGGTDVMVLKVKIGLHKRLREIANLSAFIFPYSPWVIPPFEKAIGLDRVKCRNLPVLPGFDALRASEALKKKRLVTLIRFDDWKNKNLARVISTVRMLNEKYPGLTLDIYGGGSAQGMLKVQSMIAREGLQAQVVLKGPVANESLPRILGQYSALVMPSFSETYGLAYAEALFCGVPVLFSKSRAIDGYFNTAEIGYACDPGSAADVAAGIGHILQNETTLKRGIALMQTKGAFEAIRRDGILKTYRDSVNAALTGH